MSYLRKSAGWKKFFHLPAHEVKCASEYIFLISKKNTKITREKAKETKEKTISVANLTG